MNIEGTEFFKKYSSVLIINIEFSPLYIYGLIIFDRSALLRDMFEALIVQSRAAGGEGYFAIKQTLGRK